jgi:hypothetical protein
VYEWARYYAIQFGWAVFPVQAGGKEPLTPHGVKDATTDPETIKEWWTRWPSANIGIACGAESDLLVVDVDPRNGGELALNALMEEQGVQMPDTTTAFTGGAGKHYYLKFPSVKLRKTLCAGVDLQGEGKYVVAPPSLHATGGVYTWEVAPDVARNAAVPQWIIDTAERKGTINVNRIERVVDPDDTRPGAVFNASTEWADILVPHGWRLFGYDGAGVTQWTRPGKSEGISATTNYEGSDLLYVFSSSTEFEPERGYDKFGAYALLNHGGDITEAAKAVRLAQPQVVVPESDYTFKHAFEDGHFVTRYIEWASAHTDAPLEYHEAAALSLLSHASPHTRGDLSMHAGGLPLNLYLILAGGSTRWRKSTSQNLGASLLEMHGQPVPGWRVPGRTTPERLVEDMSTMAGVPAIWTPDEFGVTLAQIYRRDFLRGLEELLLTFYGCESYTLSTMKRTTTVRNPHLTVLAAATPESIAMAGASAQLGGLLPRFGVVFPRTLPAPRPATNTTDLSEVKRGLNRELREMSFTSGGRIAYDPDALALLNAAEASLVEKRHALRLPVMLYKVSALSAVSARRDTVSAADARGAIRVVNRWADGAAHLSTYLNRKAVDFEFEHDVDEAVDCIRRHGGRAYRSVVGNELRLRERTMKEVAETLHGRGRMVVEQGPGGSGEIWRLV